MNKNFVIDTIKGIIVSVIKLSVVIGPPPACLSRNWRAIMRVSNYGHPITKSCNWIPVIGYPRELRVNYAGTPL